MITSISTNFSIRADKEYARYMVVCSAGETIAMNKEGKVLESVVMSFYKLSTEGAMTAFSAPWVLFRYKNKNGAMSTPISYGNRTSVDITDWLNNFGAGTLAAVEVSVYAADEKTLLAKQSFAAVYPGDDVDVWFITLSEAYYNVDAKKNVSAKLTGTLYHRKGDTTEAVSGAVLKFGYSTPGYEEEDIPTMTTDSQGKFDDSNWFDGDVWNDSVMANSSKSIYVSYERNGVLETSQVVTVSIDGEQGEPGDPGADGVTYTLTLNTGATVPCTSDAELKAETLTLQLLKDGTAKSGEYISLNVPYSGEARVTIYLGGEFVWQDRYN